MQSKATTPREYLASLPDDRRKAIEAIRKVLKANLDPRIKEGISYGMLGYSVPLSLYPDGYHCNPDQPLPFANLASQKNHMALYLFASYTKPAEIEWLKKAWKAAGKKADIGKSCIRFKSLDDVPLDVVAEAIQRMDVDTFIEAYEKALEGTPAGKKLAAKRKREAEGGGAKGAAPQKKAAKKTAKKAAKKATKKVAAKKKAAKKPAVEKAATKKAAAKKTPSKKATAKKPAAKKPAAKKTAKKVSKKASARAKSAAKPAAKKK